MRCFRRDAYCCADCPSSRLVGREAGWDEDKELGFTRKTTSESETDATVPWDRLDALCPES